MASEAATAKIVRFHKLGKADVLQIEDLPVPEPGPGEARLRVKAIGINRAECVFRKGQYLVQPVLPSKLGYEASGTVEAIGEGVDKGWLGKTASTVPAFRADQYGVYGEVAIVPAGALAEYPSKLSLEEGTSIWMQYTTAYGALIHFGKLKKGDFVIITAASSSVGIAAIEMVRAEGAVAIATTRTDAKRQVLLDAGAHHVIATETEDLVARVNEFTGGKGARIVFDPVGGPTLEKLAAATAFQGIIFEYGALSRDPTPFPLFSVLSKSITVRGYTLFEISSDPEVRPRLEKYIVDRIAKGDFKPRIDRIFPFVGIADAQRYMETNEQIGKIVVSVP